MCMEQIARTRVAVNGGSFIVRIPKQICKLMGISKGECMSVYREGDSLIFRKEVKQE